MNNKTYSFEASGGLLHASLVMQDRETDTYWSIMTDEAIHGQALGTPLRKLPGSRKATWGAWKAQYPHSKVLSVDGKEHNPDSHYEKYFTSDRTMGDLTAGDKRLDDKDHLYAFEWQGKAYAVPQKSYQGGAVFDVAGRQLFLYREPEDSFYRSTAAYLVGPEVRIESRGKGWVVVEEDRRYPFRVKSRNFGKAGKVEEFTGFDTFWYIWRLTQPETEVLGADTAADE